MLSAAAPTAEREQSPACRLDEYRKGIRHSSDERLLPVSWWRAKNLVVGEPGKERKQFESSQDALLSQTIRNARSSTYKAAFYLSDQTGQTRRLSCPRPRFTSRQHGYLERALTPN